ncbi:glycosyltransferase family 4 protein [Ferruginibacter albus]|uniref:glycosyltransferase family 4 protein n=1 Tax=Ferruginibacter albus TaxID=2875540 RepID=UPI001CC3680D|nr:glycosyltransferase family 4 protein [Ferruginibacter albus]UAY50703.1 glycosyltransferase family 4 protein [Ferruginibacter albus]
MNKKVLFLTLKIFSAAGGIERVCRILGKAISELNENPQQNVAIYSMYDKSSNFDSKYFSKDTYKAFDRKKTNFVINAVRQGVKSDIVILSHINLLLPGFLIKLFSPKTKLVLLAHGIEVWDTFPKKRIKMLNSVDKILAVSRFTQDKMTEYNQPDKTRFTILNNCLDPFLPALQQKDKDTSLMKKYNFSENDIILMTLSRLTKDDRYKNYDNVINVVSDIKVQHPNLKYFLVGKYSEEEKQRLEKFIKEKKVQDSVVFAGYIPDEELAAHYNLCDVFIMPSQKEGFGIAFIEAMFYGKPVIAGNQDGSTDALCNGQLGLLVNPDNLEDIKSAVLTVLSDIKKYKPSTDMLMQHFSYPTYKNNLQKAIEQL